MPTLDSSTLMFANATVAGAVAAMSFGYARGQIRGRSVASGWGWLMLVFCIASFAWFLNGSDTAGPAAVAGNLAFAVFPALAMVAFGRLSDRQVHPTALLLLSAPGALGALTVWVGAPRYWASIPIGASFVIAAMWALGLLALQQRRRPSMYRLALLLTLSVVVLVCAARLVAASTGFHQLVVPLSNSALQTLAVLSATLFITAGSVSVFGLLEERRLDQAVEEGQHDGLTNVLLRKPFLERSAAVIDSAGVSFSVIVLDLDHFKRINDSHGHAAGDAVIKDCARVLADHVRGVDLVARLGGEEFAVMLPRCQMDEARLVAERIVEQIRQRRVITSSGHLLRYTASVGIAQGEGASSLAAVALREALEQADIALYHAKRAGRDRVVCAGGGQDGNTTEQELDRGRTAQ